jgi:hypothetical protein
MDPEKFTEDDWLQMHPVWVWQEGRKRFLWRVIFIILPLYEYVRWFFCDGMIPAWVAGTEGPVLPTQQQANGAVLILLIGCSGVVWSLLEDWNSDGPQNTWYKWTGNRAMAWHSASRTWRKRQVVELDREREELKKKLNSYQEQLRLEQERQTERERVHKNVEEEMLSWLSEQEGAVWECEEEIERLEGELAYIEDKNHQLLSQLRLEQRKTEREGQTDAAVGGGDIDIVNE